MCIECGTSPCHPRCPNAEGASDYVVCSECGTEMHYRQAKRLFPHGEPYCQECFTEAIERLCGFDKEEEE